MKLIIPNRKDWTMIFVFLLGVFIIYFSGVQDRIHPDEYIISFNSSLKQPDHITCGPTSATMILNHYGKRVNIDEVKKFSKTVWLTYNMQDIGMTSPDYLSIAMSKYGIPSTLRYGNLDVLKHCVSQNKPCIVLVRSGETLWHYIVVYGFSKDKIMIADPGGGVLYEMNQDTFRGCWSWATDMQGNKCTNDYICTLLNIMEVYSHTFICPDKSSN